MKVFHWLIAISALSCITALENGLRSLAGSCGSQTPSTGTTSTIRIKASTYCASFGVRLETTLDTDGGQDVGWIDANDWMAWDVYISASGKYQVSYRVASLTGGGSLQLESYGGLAVFGQLPNLPNTGGWQTWTNVAHVVDLAQGQQTLAVKALAAGWNLNWVEISPVSTASGCSNSSDATTLDPTQATRILASSYCDMLGAQMAPQGYLGWIDPNDSFSYVVDVPQSAIYTITYNVASPTGTGGFTMTLYSYSDPASEPQVVTQINSLPATNGWLNWADLDQQSLLQQGTYLATITATQAGWNFNWMEFTVGTKSGPVPTGYVRASGTSIMDGVGNDLLLRGMAVGNWFLQEPYMMLVDGKVKNGQHEILANVAALIGPRNTILYRQAWLDNYITENDVMAIAAAGFNSLRVPMHYNLFTFSIQDEPVRGQDTWITEDFVRIDTLLKWCKTAGIYLILDLHAAPGGQGRDANINDYDSTKPSLWEDAENVRKTIALWVQLATRYQSERWIAGYDLLNEPNWNFEPGHPNGCTDTVNAPLKSFYDTAVAAIRQVDTNHLLFIEGNCWATNNHGLWPIVDDNVALSFHRYWVDNTVGTIQTHLDYRNQYNVPLWMGESGENNNYWYSEAVKLLESNNIGWAWWNWKKLESDSGSYSVPQPDGYQTLVNYWNNGGTQPTADFAYGVMMQLTQNIKLANCRRNDAAITALVQPVRTCQAADVFGVRAKGANRIEAENYCEMLGVNTEDCTDVGGGYDVGWFDAGDYLTYNVNVKATGIYVVKYRVASMSGSGGLKLFSNSRLLGKITAMPVTGGWQNWQTVSHKVRLIKGAQRITIKVTAPGWNMNWFQMSRTLF